MAPETPYFKIHEQQENGRLRLQLTGELDLGSEPVLRTRLEQLRAGKKLVCLDLSGIEFMDCRGIHLLISEFNEARENGWGFEVGGDVSPQLERLFKLTNLERFTRAQLQQSVGRRALRT